VGLYLPVFGCFFGLVSARRVGGTGPTALRAADLTAFTTSKVFFFCFFATVHPEQPALPS
jgi:hypothetical protein